MLETKIPLIPEIIQRLRLTHQHDVLDPDPKSAVGVVSRLYADTDK